jgi:hypothetical protein
VREEIDDGIKALCDYLRAWARFGQWCAQRGELIT